jgi:hypothetical protein
VTELRRLLAQGGAEARPAVEAILAGAHFVATPVLVDGRKRWDLRARIAGGYLYRAAGAVLPSLCAPQKLKIRGRLPASVEPNPSGPPAGISAE